MSRLVLAQDGRVMSLLGTFEPLSELPEQLRWEVWHQLPPWKRRTKASGLIASDRLARLNDEAEPEVVLALSQGLPTAEVLAATATRPLVLRTLAHLGSLDEADREALARELLLRTSTRRIIEAHHGLIFSAEAHVRLWCEFAKRFELKRVLSMYDHPDELSQQRRDILIERLFSCHTDSKLARQLALKIMQYEPPKDARRLLARTSRLGETHTMLSVWACMGRPTHVPEPDRSTQTPAEYEAQRVRHLMTEACASNWFEYSPEVANLDEDSLRELLKDVTYCAQRALKNPSFPRHLWFVILEFEDAAVVVDWWEKHPDIDGRELASVLVSLAHHGLRHSPSPVGRYTGVDPVTPERVNALLSLVTPTVLAAAFSVMPPNDRARVAGELTWIGEHHPEVLGFLDVHSFQRFIDRSTALALVGWMKESLTTMRDWETFEAVCEANQNLSIADALRIVADVQKHP